MAATAAPDYPKGLDFEQVWAMFKETDQKFKETAQTIKETNQTIKENAQRSKETERYLKRLGRQMGDLHHSFGEIAEHLVAPGIADRFNELGYKFDAVSPGGHRILDEKGKIKTEIDIVLENSDCIMAVEVKTKPKVQDNEHHIKRLEILREHRNKHNDKRTIKGAIAGAVFGSMEKQAVLEAGLYAIEQSGDTMKLDLPDGFIPKEWKA